MIDDPPPPPPPNASTSSSSNQNGYDDTDDPCLNLDDDERLTAVGDSSSDDHRNRNFNRYNKSGPGSIPDDPLPGPDFVMKSRIPTVEVAVLKLETRCADDGDENTSENESHTQCSTSTAVQIPPEQLRRSPSPTESLGSNHAPDAAKEEDDDEFGDFEEFGGFVEITQEARKNFNEHDSCSTEQKPVEIQVATDDWSTAFPVQPSTSSEKTTIANDDDDWIATFAPVVPIEQSNSAETSDPAEAAAAAILRQRVSSTVEEEIRLPKTLECLADPVTLWNGDDEDNDSRSQESGDDAIVSDLIADFDSEDYLTRKPENKEDDNESVFMRGRELWLAARIVEETRALQLQWLSSLTRNGFLNALNVDAQVAKQRQSNLPVFAQHLGGNTVLQPLTQVAVTSTIESSGASAANSTVNYAAEQSAIGFDSSPSPATRPSPSASPKHQPTEAILRMTAGSNSVSMRPNPAPTNSTANVDSLSVPPAQFDWSDSGLSNPLTGAKVTATSAILDLDFLTTNENFAAADGGISSALQRDLDAFGLSSSKTAAKVEAKPSVLEELMKKTEASSSGSVNGPGRKYKPVGELSLDARLLCEALPNLDYMFSNVLMFPIGGNSR